MDTQLVLAGIRDVGLAVTPVVAAWIGTHIKNQSVREVVNSAVGRAGGIAYHYLVARASGINPTDARQRAINEGVSYLTTAIPDTLKDLGVPSERMRSMVTAELGKLLAVDPSVTVNAGPWSTPPKVMTPSMPPPPLASSSGLPPPVIPPVPGTAP